MTAGPLMTPDELMARIGGYQDRDAFMRMTRRAGLRRVKINKRVIRFDRTVAEAWLKRREA